MSDLVPPPFTSGKTLMERVEDALLPLINLVFLLLMFFAFSGLLLNHQRKNPSRTNCLPNKPRKRYLSKRLFQHHNDHPPNNQTIQEHRQNCEYY